MNWFASFCYFLFLSSNAGYKKRKKFNSKLWEIWMKIEKESFFPSSFLFSPPLSCSHEAYVCLEFSFFYIISFNPHHDDIENIRTNNERTSEEIPQSKKCLRTAVDWYSWNVWRSAIHNRYGTNIVHPFLVFCFRRRVDIMLAATENTEYTLSNHESIKVYTNTWRIYSDIRLAKWHRK